MTPAPHPTAHALHLVDRVRRVLVEVRQAAVQQPADADDADAEQQQPAPGALHEPAPLAPARLAEPAVLVRGQHLLAVALALGQAVGRAPRLRGVALPPGAPRPLQAHEEVACMYRLERAGQLALAQSLRARGQRGDLRSLVDGQVADAAPSRAAPRARWVISFRMNGCWSMSLSVQPQHGSRQMLS